MQTLFAMLRIVALLTLAALMCAVSMFIMFAAMAAGMLKSAWDTGKESVEFIDAMIKDFWRWIANDIEMIRALWIAETPVLGPGLTAKAEGLSGVSPSADPQSSQDGGSA